MTETDLCLGGERLVLDAGGAVLWPARKLMAVADLHLEKGSAAAAKGSLLPPWDSAATLDRLAPAAFTTPLGRAVPIDYDGDHPSIEVRLQELFGVTTHPTVGAQRLPLRITLLSPARAALQTTLDLPRFWATSYADVRKDMRGQYPRHPWPEDPTEAEPTLKAKPRGT